MAKLMDINFRKTGNSGDEVDFKSSVTVDSEGTFFFSIPDYLEDILMTVPLYYKGDSRYYPKDKVISSHIRGKYRVLSKSMAVGKDAIKQAIDEYLKAEKKEEMVVLYTFTTTCHYAKDDRGNVYPNCEPIFGGNLKHSNPTHNSIYWNSDHDYKVGIRANVRNKIIYTRQNSKKCEYERPTTNSLGNYGVLLNKFNHMYINTGRDNFKEIPYTEEKAKMFYDAIRGLCKLADIVYEALKDPEKLPTGNLKLLS